MNNKFKKQGLLGALIGKKMLMGITGLFLIMFLVVHCAVNALIFANDGGELFNKGAEFMGTNILIRTMEVVLFIGLLAHAFDGIYLERKNRQARSVKYVSHNPKANSTWYSRSMAILGILILMFLIVHLKHFWWLSRFTDHIAHSEATKLSGQETLFEEMKEVFQNPMVVVLYVAAMFSLAYHLMHGFQSAFQTMGWNHPKYTPCVKQAGFWFSIIIPLVFALMPIALYTGIIK
ncbi:MAG: succinate dehydrogenase cytochrome b subunit [Bacteroidia bacterium]|nr:succinate dehydrogenase cytochrome b subunit [Bacteroidia bacterium]MCZ2248617.1 succinate dehydrogenase cytochrome b subunit [Bacteroidia bacterium]